MGMFTTAAVEILIHPLALWMLWKQSYFISAFSPRRNSVTREWPGISACICSLEGGFGRSSHSYRAFVPLLKQGRPAYCINLEAMNAFNKGPLFIRIAVSLIFFASSSSLSCSIIDQTCTGTLSYTLSINLCHSEKLVQMRRQEEKSFVINLWISSSNQGEWSKCVPQRKRQYSVCRQIGTGNRPFWDHCVACDHSLQKVLDVSTFQLQNQIDANTDITKCSLFYFH